MFEFTTTSDVENICSKLQKFGIAHIQNYVSGSQLKSLISEFSQQLHGEKKSLHGRFLSHPSNKDGVQKSLNREDLRHTSCKEINSFLQFILSSNFKDIFW